MKHYPHHIGDFNHATRHLTRIERSVYRDLIELYYDLEKQLPLDVQWICRRILATTNDESTAVEQALNEFFIKTPIGYWHDRCEAELEKFNSNSSQKAIAGKASAAKRALKRQQALNACSTDVETPLNGALTESSNHKPSTINHKPIEESGAATPTTPPKADKSKGSRLPDDWSLPDDCRAWAATEFPNVNPSAEAAKFRDYWLAKSGADGRKADWSATWRNWIRRAAENRQAAPTKQRHNDFDNRDYTAGVTSDGGF